MLERGTQRISTEGRRETVLEALEDLKDDIGREFRAFEREEGIPEL